MWLNAKSYQDCDYELIVHSHIPCIHCGPCLDKTKWEILSGISLLFGFFITDFFVVSFFELFHPDVRRILIHLSQTFQQSLSSLSLFISKTFHSYLCGSDSGIICWIPQVLGFSHMIKCLVTFIAHISFSMLFASYTHGIKDNSVCCFRKIINDTVTDCSYSYHLDVDDLPITARPKVFYI